MCLGCSGVVPSIHLMISLGFIRGVEQGALGWLVLMGALYIIGALMYAFRVPERFFPGRCNFWVSHYLAFSIIRSNVLNCFICLSSKTLLKVILLGHKKSLDPLTKFLKATLKYVDASQRSERRLGIAMISCSPWYRL